MAESKAKRAEIPPSAKPQVIKPQGTKPQGVKPRGTKNSSTKRPAARKRGAKSKRTGRQRALLVGKWTLIAFLAFLLIGLIGGGFFYQSVKLPAPNQEFTTETTFLYYRDGATKLGDLAVQNRQPINYQSIPQSVKDAVISAEDRTFWTNRGISITGIARSAWAILRGGDIAGGSTITQQYIKILYLTSERSLTRKLREFVLAVKMNNAESKENILTGYLNTIYFGRGAYGIQAAAQAYFGVDAQKLTVPQAASLAAILNSPAYLDPADLGNVKRFTERYEYVIQGMADLGTITPAQRDEFIGAPPQFPKIAANQRYAGAKGFVIKMVEDELQAKGFTQSQINGGGLRVTTTFDANLQENMVKSAQATVAKANERTRKKVGPDDLKVGMASVAVGTGEVLAIYGGPDYVKDSRNWALTPRPAASTFKPYTLVAALREGFSLKSIVRGNAWTPPGDAKSVNNAGFVQFGNITLQRATEVSSNAGYVDVISRLADGPQATTKVANDLGVASGAGWDQNLRLPLGVAEVTPLAQAGGYATFANDGRRAENHVIKEVKDDSGKVLYSEPVGTTPVIEPDIVRDVNYALKGVVERGTATGIKGLGREVAAKTGTNMIEDGSVTSSWMVAYTRQISTAVMMVGGESGTRDLNDWTTDTGRYPAMLWLDYMKVATQDQPKLAFDPPANVNGDGREKGKMSTPTPTPTAEAPVASAPPVTPAASPIPSLPPTTPPPTNTSSKPR